MTGFYTGKGRLIIHNEQDTVDPSEQFSYKTESESESDSG